MTTWTLRSASPAKTRCDTVVVGVLSDGSRPRLAPGGDDVASALEQSGYTVLRNQHRTLTVRGAPLHVVGVDDPVTRKDDIAASFDGVPEAGTRLVLCHCPEKAGELLSPPDVELVLQFSGEGRKAELAARTPAGASWLSSLRFSS